MYELEVNDFNEFIFIQIDLWLCKYIHKYDNFSMKRKSHWLALITYKLTDKRNMKIIKFAIDIVSEAE